MLLKKLPSSKLSNSILGNEESDDLGRKLVSPTKMRLKPSMNKSLDSLEDNNATCDRCISLKETTLKALNLIKSYIENINERLNYFCLNIDSQKPNQEYFKLPIEYLHSVTYTELDRLNITSDFSIPFRQVIKSLRLFSDKYECITRKQNSIDKARDEHKASLLQSRKEEVKCPDSVSVKQEDNSSIQNILLSFNNAKQFFESNMKELKSNLNNTNNNVDIGKADVSEYIDKDCQLKNDLTRVRKENTSLRVIFNFKLVGIEFAL
jgi:hypothetical protein